MESFGSTMVANCYHSHRRLSAATAVPILQAPRGRCQYCFWRKRKNSQTADCADSRIADSSSINAVSFSSACTTKRFPSSRCASAIQIVRPSGTQSPSPRPHPLFQTNNLWGKRLCGPRGAERRLTKAVLIFHTPGRVSPRLIPGTPRQSFDLPTPAPHAIT
jgi:hypothetical protein